MTNERRQLALDKKKWLESERQGKDMSGQMSYCNYCKSKVLSVDDCRCASESDRVQRCLCATAYNRMIRIINKGVR